MFRKTLSCARLLAFFSAQPRCVVAMEACAGAHHWGRELIKLGHAVRLIPPACVKPFVKRQKNDVADAEGGRRVSYPQRVGANMTVAAVLVRCWL